MTRHRWIAAAGVGLFLGGMHALAPDAARREAWSLLVALPIGYGHLIGGALTARGRYRSLAPAGVPPRAALAFGVVSVACLLAAYTHALQSPALRHWTLAGLLVFSGWHIVENDIALARAARRGFALGGLARGPRAASAMLLASGALALAALATPSGRQWSLLATGRALPAGSPAGLGDLASAVLMYHAFSFLVFAAERTARLPPARAARLRRLLLACHGGPLVLNALLYFWLDALHALVASPELYLFWSVLHAVQTAALRVRGGSRLAPGGPAGAGV